MTKRIVVDASVEHGSIEELVMVEIAMVEIALVETMMIEIVIEKENHPRKRGWLYTYTVGDKIFFFQFQS